MSDMPERLNVTTYTGGKSEGGMVEYLRSGLAPAWHDKPTCEGVWLLRGRIALVVEVRDSEPWYIFGFGESAPCSAEFGKWYGPIPEDKE